jgi:hypothetical protein
MKKLIWRLGKLPSVDELQSLVKDKIITQEEARDILFKSESDEDRDKESLKSEIKFLRELVQQLSGSQNRIIETIKYIEKPYYKWSWYEPYRVYCQTSDLVTYTTSTSANIATATTNGTNLVIGTSGSNTITTHDQVFTDINTF